MPLTAKALAGSKKPSPCRTWGRQHFPLTRCLLMTNIVSTSTTQWPDSAALERDASVPTACATMAKAPEATAGLCLNYYVMTLAKYTLHDHHFVVMALKQSLTKALTTTKTRASTSCVAHWGKEPRVTAVTGTGCTRFLRHVAEYFNDYYANNSCFDFQGASAYLDWNFVFKIGGYVFPELYFTLLHTSCRNFNIVTFYMSWDFVISTWNFELPVTVTDWLSKHVLSYDIILITCITVMVRERTCLRTLHLSSTCILQHSRHYCTLKVSYAAVSFATHLNGFIENWLIGKCFLLHYQYFPTTT